MTVFFINVASSYEPVGFVKTPSEVTHLDWSLETFVCCHHLSSQNLLIINVKGSSKCSPSLVHLVLYRLFYCFYCANVIEQFCDWLKFTTFVLSLLHFEWFLTYSTWCHLLTSDAQSCDSKCCFLQILLVYQWFLWPSLIVVGICFAASIDWHWRNDERVNCRVGTHCWFAVLRVKYLRWNVQTRLHTTQSIRLRSRVYALACINSRASNQSYKFVFMHVT